MQTNFFLTKQTTVNRMIKSKISKHEVHQDIAALPPLLNASSSHFLSSDLLDLIFTFVITLPEHVASLELVSKQFFSVINSSSLDKNKWYYIFSREQSPPPTSTLIVDQKENKIANMRSALLSIMKFNFRYVSLEKAVTKFGETKKEEDTIKIALMGKGGVGKTALTDYFRRGIFVRFLYFFHAHQLRNFFFFVFACTLFYNFILAYRVLSNN